MKRSGITRKRSPKATEYAEELAEIRPEVLLRARGHCRAGTPVCTERAAHAHHRKMRSHGGTNDFDNLLAVCWPCHRYIHHYPTESYERGWLIRGV